MIGRHFKIKEEEEEAPLVESEETKKFIQVFKEKQNEPDSGPTIKSMAASFLGAIRQEISDTISKKEKLSDSDVQKRREICAGCEHLSGGRCKKCGCFLKIKTLMRSQHCPIGKW
jgi:hypothetical protein